MAKAMAIKDRTKARRQIRKRDNSEYRSKLKDIAHNSAITSKIMMHNGFMVIIFGLAMLLTAVAALELEYMAAGFAIGKSTNGAFSTLSDIVIVAVSILITSAFVLFFAFKIENALMKGCKSRFWHRDGVTGEIIKTGKKNCDDSDIKIYEADDSDKKRGNKK